MNRHADEISAQSPREWLVASVALCLAVGLFAFASLWMVTMPARGVRYVLSWDTTDIVQTDEGWTARDGDVEVVVTSLELVTYSVELMPCPDGGASSLRIPRPAVLARAFEWVIPNTFAGHSGTRNDIATPFAVIERPLTGTPLTLEPSVQGLGNWCRVHWLVARRDDDTLVDGATTIPERHSLRVAGVRRSADGEFPFDVTTTLANGRYLELLSPVDSEAGADVHIVRDAGALVRSLGAELTPAAQERALLRALFETASVSASGGTP